MCSSKRVLSKRISIFSFFCVANEKLCLFSFEDVGKDFETVTRMHIRVYCVDFKKGSESTGHYHRRTATQREKREQKMAWGGINPHNDIHTQAHAALHPGCRGSPRAAAKSFHYVSSVHNVDVKNIGGAQRLLFVSQQRGKSNRGDGKGHFTTTCGDCNCAYHCKRALITIC